MKKAYVVLGILVGVVIAVSDLAIMRSSREKAMSQCCKTNLPCLLLGTLRMNYATAHGGRLPKTSGKGWIRDAKGFIATQKMLKCPADKGPGPTSYLLTPETAGKKVADVLDQIVLIEDRPRHNGVAHAVLGNGQVIEVRKHAPPTNP